MIKFVILFTLTTLVSCNKPPEKMNSLGEWYLNYENSKELKEFIKNNYAQLPTFPEILTSYADSSILVSDNKVIFRTGYGHLSECNMKQVNDELVTSCDQSLFKRNDLKCHIDNDHLICKALSKSEEPTYIYSRNKQNISDWWGDLSNGLVKKVEKSSQIAAQHQNLKSKTISDTSEKKIIIETKQINDENWKNEFNVLKKTLFSIEQACVDNTTITQSIYHYKNPIYWVANDLYMSKKIISDLSSHFLQTAETRISLMNALKKFKDNSGISSEDALKQQDAYVSNNCMMVINDFTYKSKQFLLR